MKRMVLSVFLCVMAAGFLSAGGNRQKSDGGAASFKSNSPIYADYDLSQPLKIYIYMLGDVPKDMDEIIAKANADYFKPTLNTEVEMVFLAWSDYEVKYPLVLSGGDDVDIIFTSSWAFYDQEAGKGAFVELTDDFVSRWMPNVNKMQPPNSWPQVLTGGKIYAIPRMYAGTQGYKFVGIRDDLREKYGLTPPRDWATMKNYLFAIAENEKGIQALASAGENEEVLLVYLQTLDVQLTENPVYFAWQNNNHQEPAPNDLVFLYTSEWYRNFAMEMREWAEKGVWSRNVMNNTIQTTDSFAQGTSASIFWNDAVFTAGINMEANRLGKAGYYDLSPGKMVRRASYSGDCWAISTSSENPERAALVIDLMKTNLGLVNLLQGGIEGRHYLDQGDGTYLPGPEASDYNFNSWAWALGNPNSLRLAYDSSTPPARISIFNSLEPRVFEPVIDGFRIDMGKISTEWTVISALIEEYSNSFECGAFGDQTAAKIGEFSTRLRNAGLDKLTQEFRTQYAAFLEKYK
ncbi:MAG: extracellular solute-binding protein [Treponema sp.]|jgi:ABC-type glycerol-3-phosphate transport system substrate-binding protein|nr:extracellular solute-binding protein [Treponema sp.]